VARCDFPTAGTEVCCAVSGGADSLALLALAVEAGCVVTAVHVDHGLRSGSAREAEVVRSAAEQLGAAFRAERVTVEPGPNVEARARAARYVALPPDVLVGHTADDQAETVLLNLVRGAALDGLAGMAPARRPLRRLRRFETRALCLALGLDPVVDPSNQDPAFRRNRVRHELIPLLSAIGDRGVVPALARRAVRAWVRAAGPGGAEHHPPDAAAVARVLAVARGEAVACELAGGWRVARTAGRLRLEEPRPPRSPSPPPLPDR
jgi:tRNA(Ile)-lysidine synthase